MQWKNLTEKMLYHTFSTQQEIDQEYNPRLIVDNFELNVESYFTESKRVLKEYAHQSGVAYGPTKAEILDIFPADTATAPIHMFFMGATGTILKAGILPSWRKVWCVTELQRYL